MVHNQGGMQSINETSGNAAMNMSETMGMVLNYSFGDITRANFSQGSEVAGKQRFTPAEVIADFTDNGAVGINPFCLDAERGSGKNLHAVG